MHNSYPGGLEDGSPFAGTVRVSAVLTGGMTRVFSRNQAVGADGHSVMNKDTLARLAAVTGTETIHENREAEEAEVAKLNELAELMEEAPGA